MFLAVLVMLALCLGVGSEVEVATQHSIELTQSLNLARQEHIQRACAHLPPALPLADAPVADLEHILVNHKHRLLYCYVPKVACTNWKRILMILADKWNDTNVLEIPASLAHSAGMHPSLASVPPAERAAIVDEYHKLIFVRNPFERLLSAYRNKLEGDSESARYFQKRVGRRIVKAFRPGATNESLDSGADVSFVEFAEFLTSRADEFADVVNNEHWQPVTSLCHPCLVRYTIVGKYETLLDDSLLALNTINASHIPFPRSTRTSGTAGKLARYFRQLPLPLIRRLYKLYHSDFKIFNYGLENIVGFDIG